MGHTTWWFIYIIIINVSNYMRLGPQASIRIYINRNCYLLTGLDGIEGYNDSAYVSDEKFEHEAGRFFNQIRGL